MFSIHRVEKEIGGKVLSLETGRIARQAHGAVVAQIGETMVLATVVSSPQTAEDIDYFPLSVEYREKYSAAGRFPGGFLKREGRPSTKEILTARMIDRPLRPLFPDGYFDEVQVFASVLSADPLYDPDVLAMIASSAALAISKIPFLGPLGACRLSRIEGKHVFFPTYEEQDKSDFNLILAGRREAVNMIEVDAKQIPEKEAADAIAQAHQVVCQVCDLIDELVARCGQQKEGAVAELNPQLIQEITQRTADDYRRAYQIQSKRERIEALNKIAEQIIPEYAAPETGAPRASLRDIVRILDKVQRTVVRQLLLEGKRPDGRGFTDIRPISCEVGLLPRSHGSALFTRGETQALVTCTLGTGRDEQTVDGLTEEYAQSFMLHYNFPPFCVGEVRPVRGPSRREIGHGALAEKALEQVKPTEEEFPYTIKIVSDITESNGSSSMASVCGGTLALMDAGVPIKKPVAGISIGLVSEGSRYELLTDIIGDEDHYGDMDFKIAGTDTGITAIQLDIKAEGLSHEIMVEAMERARRARLQILEIMKKTIEKPRPSLSPYAPKIITIKIDPEYIGKVIGPSGKMVKSIQEQTGSLIEIEEDGTISISCVGGNGHLVARDIIEAMTTPPQVGRIYRNAKVVAAKDFGVFVEITPGVEGLCHISELSDGYVKNVQDVCKVGDAIDVKLISIDEQGRFKLSRKAALLETEKNEKSKASQVQQNS
ncbi:MAG TPA: polyribonucleotide nucleotidyltransferase [Anaerohalosphaeraceae bacterium]|nr:polyribonucleotide nucleotidyltransferase [Anaerohalosphaeraceae bacterium]HPB93513.1 polyribonucleotide nucleotidyltransferase [Anaerohalosphaeraceae bacterium]